MGALQLKQLRNRLLQDVVSLVDVSDLTGHDPAHVEKNALSRAVAAFALMRFWAWEVTDAVGAITDGPGDNGIDLVAIDLAAKRVMLVQSKWHEGSGSMSKAEILAFKQGIDDLLNDHRAAFKGAIDARWNEIEEALSEPTVRIDLICAHSGSGPLGQEVAGVMEPVLSSLNEWDDVAAFHYLGQKELHGFLTSVSTPIEIEVELSDWGVMEGPPRAFYGHVSTSDVAAWHGDHGDALFNSNLRSTLPDSAVNDGIRRTLADVPEHFWYFNNGITALCDKIEKAPGGTSDRRVGTFRFTGVQVVNGAQTVGSIASAAGIGKPSPDESSHTAPARVMVRFIELEGAGESFASGVTRWTNTQNRVGGRDFLALDPQQARIATEFDIDGLKYVFRSGEADPPHQEGCGVLEATVALACASADIRHAVQAKREVSRLWADIEKAPYKLLFNPATTADRVWVAVRILRSVEAHLETARSKMGGRRRSMLVHLNRVATWMVHRRVGQLQVDLNSPFADVQAQLDALVPPLVALLASTADNEYPGYPANLAKNAGECERIALEVLDSL